MEEIEALGLKRPALRLVQRTREGDVPNEVVRIHRREGVATAHIKREVRSQNDGQRQAILQVSAQAHVACIDRLEAAARTRKILPRDACA